MCGGLGVFWVELSYKSTMLYMEAWYIIVCVCSKKYHAKSGCKGTTNIWNIQEFGLEMQIYLCF